MLRGYVFELYHNQQHYAVEIPAGIIPDTKVIEQTLLNQIFPDLNEVKIKIGMALAEGFSNG